jgi:hypothetical protein
MSEKVTGLIAVNKIAEECGGERDATASDDILNKTIQWLATRRLKP